MKKYICLVIIALTHNHVSAQCNIGPEYICGDETPTMGLSSIYTVSNVPPGNITYHWSMLNYSLEGSQYDYDGFQERVTDIPSISIPFSISTSYFLICEARNSNNTFIAAWSDLLIVPENPVP